LAAAGHRALAPDLPGYGRTRLPSSADHSLAGAAELLVAWLADEIGPAWVVGHDAGGAVAQLFAARHPELVARLSLTNSIADGSWPAPHAARHLGRACGAAPTGYRCSPSPAGSGPRVRGCTGRRPGCA
jgi:pimeloyl-ACP methyl ester carboxylesterase